MATPDDLEAFFAHRTLGFGYGKWFWRGPGYDDDWVDVTDAEVAELGHLLMPTTSRVDVAGETP